MLIITLSIVVLALILLLLITLSIIHTSQQQTIQLRKEISRLESLQKLHGADIIQLANHTASLTQSHNDLIAFVSPIDYIENEKEYFGPAGQA